MPNKFRDPIHGFIPVSDLELQIINSTPFQRLRHIKQLATTYLVYHGAEHTRFGHSLGVMHIVSRAFDAAVDNFQKRTGEVLFDNVKKEWYKQLLRLIALTHDLGHAPFSHGSEALFENGMEHEDFTKKIICETEIAQYIQEISDDFRKNYTVGEDYCITPELLWLIYGDKTPELDKKYIMPDFKFLKSFMDSELDCDKMDYLLRDSYYCGVNYGRYDLNRLISSLDVYRNESENIMQLAIQRGGIHAFEEFVIARYFMFLQVYFQKTRRYLDKLLVDNIAEILPDAKYPEDVNEFLKWDDLTVLEKIRAKRNESSTAKHFIERKVMSCVYETPAHSNSNIEYKLYKIIYNNLKDKFNCDIMKDKAKKMPHKIPMLEEFDSDSGKGIPILVDYLEKPTSIAEESILLKNLIIPININRLYIDSRYSNQAKKIVKVLLKEGDED